MFNDEFAEFLNTINFVLLGNWTIPETYARRFSYFRMSSEKVGAKKYWSKMYNYLQNDENIYGLYLMLARRDVSNFGTRSQEAYENLDMPCKRNLKKEKISNVQRYLRDICLKGEGIKGNRKDIVKLCNDFLLRENRNKILSHTFTEEMNNMNMSGNWNTGLYCYSIDNEELQERLKQWNVIDNEDLAYEQSKKEEEEQKKKKTKEEKKKEEENDKLVRKNLLDALKYKKQLEEVQKENTELLAKIKEQTKTIEEMQEKIKKSDDVVVREINEEAFNYLPIQFTGKKTTIRI